MAKKENEAAKTPEEILEEAKLEAAEIIEEAKKKAAQIGGKNEADEIALANAEGEKPVTIKLFKDNDKYKDDVQVAVNGKMYVIQRGVPVTVPQKVAWALEAQARQDEKTAAMIERKEREFEESSKAHGVEL